MPKKKTKDPKQNAQTDVVLPPFGIFSTLFDNATEHVPTTANASASLFSDNNPFRRKPQQYTPISESPKSTQILNNGVSENHDYIDEKKRKRNKEEKNPTATADPDSLIEVSEKKNDKKKKKQASDEDDETERKMKKKKKNQGSDEENKGSDLIAETTEKGESNYEGDERKKKKRKREELEKEWEEKKYGVMEGEVEGEGLEKKTVGSKRKALDNAADMLVSKEGFDDEDKLLRTVFVGNLPLKVKKKTLLKEFKKFGEVESVRIRSVPIQDTKKPKKGAILAKKINDDGDSVHAYIVFKTEESAQASLSHNMAVVEGNHIRVDRACPPRKKQKCESALLYDNKRTVFVGNLPFDVKDEELYQLFCGKSDLESNVEAVRVIRDSHLNVGKGIAYVLFKTREAANFVIRKRNLRLRDRTLRISHAKADATPSKRPYPSPVRAPSTPAKKMALGSRSPLSSDNRSDRKAKASYQGLHASKSDIQKKAHGGEKPKERLVKRPSVAARKAKANSHMDATPSKQAAGIKRKFDARTPDSSVRHKKFKRDR
ncbi:PREDICTED: RNA-binding protein 34-like isoform X2 [Lupinus angustifolius]|uniref:RNA-binding protein 34-like isoform X2 n=1 Tax=Lupinus angustifolius TaxID=3871 RepID=UPI00092F6333|nr:PREDICTED: RNA-binding protein 34-like isoform X2 [Lupinus angustifolius]